ILAGVIACPRSSSTTPPVYRMHGWAPPHRRRTTRLRWLQQRLSAQLLIAFGEFLQRGRMRGYPRTTRGRVMGRTVWGVAALVAACGNSDGREQSSASSAGSLTIGTSVSDSTSDPGTGE